MVDWVNGFIIPLIEIIFLGGIMGFVCFILIKAFHNGWTKKWKFEWKYKIGKKPYPEKTIDWVFSCIDTGIGWYGAKKLMMVKMTPQPVINETLWIYDQIILELDKKKGGIKKHGRKFERSNSKKIGGFPVVE